MKKVFNIKYWWVNILAGIVGFLFVGFFRTLCDIIEGQVNFTCTQPIVYYIGFVIIGLAILHFIISLIVKLSKKN